MALPLRPCDPKTKIGLGIEHFNPTTHFRTAQTHRRLLNRENSNRPLGKSAFLIGAGPLIKLLLGLALK